MTIKEACEGIKCAHFVDVHYNKYCNIIGLVGAQDLLLYVDDKSCVYKVSLKLHESIRNRCPHYNKLKLIAGLTII